MNSFLLFAVALALGGGTPARGQQAVSGLPPELLVARAAQAVATITFDRSLEEQALRDLAAALRQDPRNSRAKALVDLIQKRRQEREKQEQQRGQQQLRNQRPEAQAQVAQQPSGPKQKESSNAPDRTETNRRAPREEGNRLTREQAQQLLDALEQQDRRPTQRLPVRNPRQGPRW
ncbi:MAG: hypothetical protein BWY06_03330 [Candidatus Latescibacteria bacterium ADurb.Bin168]|nr:MAG: hypothetical protein BWY06_03330 [Candidatus Latescibacteria bacterium ADurb.Bin168]